MAVAGLFGFPNEFAEVLHNGRARRAAGVSLLRRDIHHSALSLMSLASADIHPGKSGDNDETPITNGKKARNGIEPDPHHGGASLSSGTARTVGHQAENHKIGQL
jgi:hypothetical protein